MFRAPGALQNAADQLSQEMQREAKINIPAATLSSVGDAILTAAEGQLNSPTLVRDEWHEAEGLIKDISGISIGEFN